MNVASLLDRAASAFPERPAIRFEARDFTYREVQEAAHRVGHALRGSGVQPGDRIAILLPNVPAYAAIYYGALAAGAIVVSLNARSSRRELAHMLRDSGSRVLFTSSTLLEQVPPPGDLEGAPLLVVCVGEPGWFDGERESTPRGPRVGVAGHPERGLAEWAEAARDTPFTETLPPRAAAAIVYSSGTTGVPKGVTLSHGNILSNAQEKVRLTGMTADDRALLSVPLFHCFGQNAILNPSVLAGGCVVLHRNFDLDHVLDSIRRDRISMLFGVPTLYLLLLEAAGRDLLESVRYALSAAATLPVEVAFRWRDTFGQFLYEGYGLSESTPFASYNHETRYVFGSIGSPIRGVEMRVADPETLEPLEPGQPGELQIRGENVMLGYWNRPVETAETILAGGWLRSGDIGRVDDAGHYYLVDRLKDMINVAGIKVWPAEVESVLYEQPSVREAAVYGVPDRITGERVVARVVLRPGFAADVAPLLEHCRRELAGYKVPTEVSVATALPKNASGKVLKRQLRESHPMC